MKKSYLILAVATSLLVSCAQSEKLNNDLRVNDVPRVIGFNTYSEKATKATSENLEKYHQTFAVWATKKSSHDTNAAPEVVFCGDSIKDIITYNSTKQDPNNWTYKPYRYWDTQAKYSFVAVAPNADIIRYNSPADVAPNTGTFVTVKPYTLIGQNLQTSEAPDTIEKKIGFTGGQGQDTDLMTSGKVSRDGATRDVSDVNLEFKHVLAKLNIAIAKDVTFDNVKVLIDTVMVSGLDDTGTYNEAISGTTTGWNSSLSSDTANYVLTWANTNGIELPNGEGEGDDYKPGKFLYFIESLVMPQSIDANVEKLTIKYTIVSTVDGLHNTEHYNYQLVLNDGVNPAVFNNFMERNNYTIFLTVRPNVITFDASTTTWTDKSAGSSIVPPVKP